MSKQREILNKAEDKRRKWEQYAPWVTLGAAILIVALLTAGLFYMGVKLDSANVEARMAECVAAGWK